MEEWDERRRVVSRRSMKERREKKGAKANVLKGFCVNARSIVNIDKRAELVDKEKPDIWL